MADLDYDIRGVNISGGSDSNAISVNAVGQVDVNWDNCPINEESIRAIAREELEKKRKELKDCIKPKEPIEIMRNKLHDWLKS